MRDREFQVSELNSLLDRIEKEYPHFYDFLVGYWKGQYLKNINPYIPEDVLDLNAMFIANRKLGQVYANMENSILGKLKDPAKRMMFELEHFIWQKKFLMGKINDTDPSAVNEAENLWRDIYEDSFGQSLESKLTFLPEYLEANKQLRRYCVYVRRQ